MQRTSFTGSQAQSPVLALAPARWCVTNLQRNSCRPTAVQPVSLTVCNSGPGRTAIHKHLQFIAHLPTKYRPIQGTFNGVCGCAPFYYPTEEEELLGGFVGVTLQHVPLHS